MGTPGQVQNTKCVININIIPEPMAFSTWDLPAETRVLVTYALPEKGFCFSQLPAIENHEANDGMQIKIK